MLSVYKFPLDLLNRRGVALAVSGFANLVEVEHACLHHGHDYACIFVLVKVENPAHIPHHISFHEFNETGGLAHVFINETWDMGCRRRRVRPTLHRWTGEATAGKFGGNEAARLFLLGALTMQAWLPSFNDIRAMFAVAERRKLQLFPGRPVPGRPCPL